MDVTDASLVAVVKRCPDLRSVRVGSPNMTVPNATKMEGGGAVLRYYQHLGEASLNSSVVKTVAMGHGMAGKTSTVRTLARADTQPSTSDTAVLTAAEDRTIALDLEELWGMLQVYDFGGQPEYFPWQKLFLTPESLYLIFVEASLPPKLMFRQVEEHLQHLYCTVGDVPVLIITSKTDLLATKKEYQTRAAQLQSMVNDWVYGMQSVKRRGEKQVGAVPKVQATVLAVSAATPAARDE